MTDTALETIDHLDFEPDLACEAKHVRRPCSGPVKWRNTPPCGCVFLVCEAAYQYRSNPANFRAEAITLRCINCKTRLPFDDWFAIGVWAPVNR